MKLQTVVDINRYEQLIGYQSRVFAIGSCFADRVGERLRRAKLRVEVNPMGVLFNPVSICGAIERLVHSRFVAAEELQEGCGSQPPFYHFDMHSSLSRTTPEQTTEAINCAIERGHRAIVEADCVIITLGTAWVYELVESGAVVANCHKLPAREFRRRRLSVEEVVQQLERVVTGVLQGKHIIFTVSPIRHLADGLMENSVSKATLRLAVELLSERHTEVSYFPAYEILVDELRDYRFYDADMVHISPLAVEYVWERFVDVALTAEAREILPRVMQLIKATEHRAVNPQSEQHRHFIERLVNGMERLPEVDFSEELMKYREFLKINL